MVNSLLMRLAAMTMQKALIIGLLFAGIYYAMFFNDGSNYESRIAQLQKDIEVEEGVKRETEQAVREVEQVRANVAALSEQFKAVSAKLPNEVSMADVIKDVDGVARAAGVSIKTKEPMAVTNKDFYEEIPLRISVEGTYSEVTMFLYYISAMERIMRVKSFRMDNQQMHRGMQTAINGRLIFDGEITAYRFVGEKKP